MHFKKPVGGVSPR